MHRRVAALAALGVAGMVVLTGCEKPKPAVTFFSGTDSTRVEAECWGEVGECAVPTTGAGSLEIRPGETVGISVDAAIADSGWVPAVGNRSLVPEPITESYYRFTLTEEQVAAGSLQVFATTGGSEFRGAWMIDVERG